MRKTCLLWGLPGFPHVPEQLLEKSRTHDADVGKPRTQDLWAGVIRTLASAP